MTTQNIYNMTDTWTVGATTYTAVKMNVTDTASAAGSLLMDLQVGGATQYNFDKAGGTGFMIKGGATDGIRLYSTDSRLGIIKYNGSTQMFLDPANADISTNSGLINSNGGVLPGVRVATTLVVTSLSNSSTAAQNVFAAANDVLTLLATTTYFFDCLYFINTGTTTHTTATGFVASSAFTSIAYLAELWSTTAGTISTTAPSVLDVTASTATVLNATSAAPRTTIRCSGMIRTNSATTVTPQITFSAGPTGTCEVAVNSYFRIWPAFDNATAAKGAWA